MKEITAQSYIDLFEYLQIDKIELCESLLSETFRFQDPFNDLTGAESFKKLMWKTIEDVKDPKFKVLNQIWQGDILFLRWRFSGQVKLIGNMDIIGMSELSFNDQGLLDHHIDYWDPAHHVYEKLPVLGGLIRFIRRPLRVL